MKAPKLPKTDSIKALARFWDKHDLTDFEENLEEVTEPVFVKQEPIRVNLDAREAKAVAELAEAKGVSREELIYEWILQKVGKADTGSGRR